MDTHNPHHSGRRAFLKSTAVVGFVLGGGFAARASPALQAATTSNPFPLTAASP